LLGRFVDLDLSKSEHKSMHVSFASFSAAKSFFSIDKEKHHAISEELFLLTQHRAPPFGSVCGGLRPAISLTKMKMEGFIPT